MNRQRGGIEMLIIYGFVFAGAVALAWSVWHSFTEGYRDEGRADVHKTYGPIIAECDKRKLPAAACVDAWLAADRDRAITAGNLSRCEASAATQSDAVRAAEQAAKDAKAATSRILADFARRSDATLAEIARLRTIAATPAASRKEACDEADSVLRALAARRMQFAPGGAASPGSPNSGSPNPGADSLRIGK